MRIPPNGWGDDPLTEFLQEHRQNQFATFDNKRDAVGRLIDIDQGYVIFLDPWTDPEPFLPVQFLTRSHSAFRASSGSVLAGQIVEAQTLLRLCLETAAYGIYIGGDVDRWEKWMRRNESASKKDRARKEFSHGNVKAFVTKVSAALGAQYSDLYDLLIDYGAHPNERGFSASTAVREIEAGIRIDTVYLHDDGWQLDTALRVAAEVGLWSLRAARQLYPERMRSLGLTDWLDGQPSPQERKKP